MNSKRYPVNNYVPHNVQNNNNDRGKETFHDLDIGLKQMTFDEITADTDYHFENCYVTNFDLINHECRDDRLDFSRKHYETISSENLKKNISSKDLQTRFISSAIRSQGKDLHIEKKVVEEHFNRRQIERNLEKRDVFLSNLRKKAFQKKNKTDECKSLFF